MAFRRLLILVPALSTAPRCCAFIARFPKPVIWQPPTARWLSYRASARGAYPHRLCETNPAQGIRRNPERSRDRFLQSDELPRFFAALADEPNTTLRDYFLVSLLTGARRGNVLTMRWQDINFERAEWRIARTKNNDPQTITLLPEAIEVLHGRNRDSEFVFPGAGACGHRSNPGKAGCAFWGAPVSAICAFTICASTIYALNKDGSLGAGVMGFVEALDEQVKLTNANDLCNAEGMLITQAHTLNEFSTISRDALFLISTLGYLPAG